MGEILPIRREELAIERRLHEARCRQALELARGSAAVLDEAELFRRANYILSELRRGTELMVATAAAALSGEGLSDEDPPCGLAIDRAPPPAERPQSLRAILELATPSERRVKVRDGKVEQIARTVEAREALGEEAEPEELAAVEETAPGHKKSQSVTKAIRPIGPLPPLPAGARLALTPAPIEIETTPLALDVAGLKPELGDVVPERRLGPRRLAKVEKVDAKKSPPSIAKAMKPIATAIASPEIDKALGALAALGPGSFLPYDVALRAKVDLAQAVAALEAGERAGRCRKVTAGRFVRWELRT